MDGNDFLIVCLAFLVGILIGMFVVNLYDLTSVPEEFVETIGNEKCAETNQSLENFEKIWDENSDKYVMVFTCEGDNADKYDSIEIRR